MKHLKHLVPASTALAHAVAWSPSARALDATGLAITRAASRPSLVAPDESFTGTARVQPHHAMVIRRRPPSSVGDGEPR